METIIKQLLQGRNRFYHRGFRSKEQDMLIGYSRFFEYSWETKIKEEDAGEEVNNFYWTLRKFYWTTEYFNYDLGMFHFRVISKNQYDLIEGKQRLMTTFILIFAIFSRIRKIRRFSNAEIVLFKEIIKNNTYTYFENIYTNNELLMDYVINHISIECEDKRESSQRIVRAFDFFMDKLKDENEMFLLSLLDRILNASCYVYISQDMYYHD